MGARPVSDHTVRRIARDTGQHVLFANGRGTAELEFVTADHRHGTWNTHTGAWQWITPLTHFTRCREHFGS